MHPTPDTHRTAGKPSTTGKPRKPRIALMGEFSAGKSSLTNLLLGQSPLPVQVTATRLPPVWISHGEESATLVTRTGEEQPVSLAALSDTSVAQARLIRLRLPVETLELCDLIDMPGISDPNMPAEVWQSMLPEIDSVLWCTPATQAWRQSEAAFWGLIQPHLRARGSLLVTHIDKLQTPRDRARVLKRLKREAGAEFARIFPLSLSEALAADSDYDIWQRSGADAFVDYLIQFLLQWDAHAQDATDPMPADLQLAPAPANEASRVRRIELRSDEAHAEAERAAPHTAETQSDAAQEDLEPAGPGDPETLAELAPVRPRRVRREAAKPRTRPLRLPLQQPQDATLLNTLEDGPAPAPLQDLSADQGA